jgi:hypothetical protein
MILAWWWYVASHDDGDDLEDGHDGCDIDDGNDIVMVQWWLWCKDGDKEIVS